MQNKLRIVIVDDHVLFREGLASIISSEPDIEVVGLAGTVARAVEVVCGLKPDVVLMDFYMPDGTGADASGAILAQCPDIKILFLTMSEADENLFMAIRSGAKGYLLKNMSPSKLVSSIRSVAKGESALSRTMTLRLMEELSRTTAAERPASPASVKLTKRELEVLNAIAGGHSNQEIAQQLFLSENTVKYHVHSILDKLNLPDRRSAADYARKNHLIN